MKSSEAQTWNEYREEHSPWIERGKPDRPYLGAITGDWLIAQEAWNTSVRLRTARFYHRWQDQRVVYSSTNGTGNGSSWGILTWENADEVAACESHGDWAINNGNGYWGGLQFAPSTWFAWGGGPFDGIGPFPYSREEQISVAVGHSLSAWPYCGRNL